VVTRLCLWLLEEATDIQCSYSLSTEARNNNGDTVLAVVGQRNRLDVIRVLLSSGADPEARNNLGEPALSMATRDLLEADTQSESEGIARWWPPATR
jgi:hypothetical protein